MPAAAPTDVQIWNIAFTALGKATVASTAATAPHAVVAASVWPLFRMQFISDHAWNGCIQTTSMTKDATAPTDTAWPVRFDLDTISNLVRVLRVNGYDIEESADRWKVVGDGSKRWLYTDTASPALVEHLTDVTTADAIGKLIGVQASYAMAWEFAALLAITIGKQPAEAEMIKMEARRMLSVAKAQDSMEGTPPMFTSGDTDLVNVRY
jgi:hypothetical protein